MKITWDEAKREKNIKKHGVDFEFAQFVFDDPCRLSDQDRIERHECRWQTIGMVDGLLFIIGHTHEDDETGDIIRIITARPATPKERKKYHEA